MSIASLHPTCLLFTPIFNFEISRYCRFTPVKEEKVPDIDRWPVVISGSAVVIVEIVVLRGMAKYITCFCLTLRESSFGLKPLLNPKKCSKNKYTYKKVKKSIIWWTTLYFMFYFSNISKRLDISSSNYMMKFSRYETRALTPIDFFSLLASSWRTNVINKGFSSTQSPSTWTTSFYNLTLKRQTFWNSTKIKR